MPLSSFCGKEDRFTSAKLWPDSRSRIAIFPLIPACSTAAIDYIALIKKIDPLLDDPARTNELRTQYGIDVRDPKKLIWELNHLDLCLYDKASDALLILREGPT
jgi:hypothetical protein